MDSLQPTAAPLHEKGSFSQSPKNGSPITQIMHFRDYNYQAVQLNDLFRVFLAKKGLALS